MFSFNYAQNECFLSNMRVRSRCSDSCRRVRLVGKVKENPKLRIEVIFHWFAIRCRCKWRKWAASNSQLDTNSCLFTFLSMILFIKVKLWKLSWEFEQHCIDQKVLTFHIGGQSKSNLSRIISNLAKIEKLFCNYSIIELNKFSS